MKLSRRHRLWFYGTLIALGISGLWWWIRHHVWLLKLHGAAAIICLIVLGTLIPTHIKRGWAGTRNLWSGNVLIGAMIGLIVTGYALYYAGGEAVRTLASWLHLVIGLASPLIIGWHALDRRKRKLSRARAA